jgi:hypothetical protein
MKDHYDFSKAVRRNPYYDELAKHGYTVQITREENGEEIIVEEYRVSPEEVRETNRIIQEHNAVLRGTSIYMRGQNA